MDHPNGTIRVLIVDDHEMFAESLACFLEHETDDIEVFGLASSVRSAVGHVVEGACPDVVLLAERLPDGEGPEAARRIKETCPETRIVMIAVSPGEHLLMRALEAGCVGVLTKEQAAEVVVGAIRTASPHEPVISPQMLMHLVPRLRQRDRAIGDDLTAREIEVLALLTEGSATQDIAEQLVLSVHTVRTHIQNLITKLGASSKLGAVMIALREGLVTIRSKR